MCIYHGNCADGFGAAWVVRKALGEIDFHGAKYQEPPPALTTQAWPFPVPKEKEEAQPDTKPVLSAEARNNPTWPFPTGVRPA
jgi:hypothetical protein